MHNWWWAHRGRHCYGNRYVWKTLLRCHGLIRAQGVPGRLNVEMRAYKPMIRCYNLPAEVDRPSGCSAVCDGMLLSNEYIHVRHERQSVLDIVVPYSVRPGKAMRQQT